MVALKGQLNEAQDNDTQTEVVDRKSRERDETQTAIDNAVKEMVAKWHEAGKPEPHSDRPSKRYVVVKEDRTPLKGMIRRAATLHKVEAILFKDHVNEDGTVAVKFTIGDKPAKSNGTAPAETPTAPVDDAPADDAPATVPDNEPPAESGRRGFRR